MRVNRGITGVVNGSTQQREPRIISPNYQRADCVYLSCCHTETQSDQRVFLPPAPAKITANFATPPVAPMQNMLA